MKFYFLYLALGVAVAIRVRFSGEAWSFVWDGPSLALIAAFVTVLLFLYRGRRAFNAIKGRAVRFPLSYSTPLDKVWIALVPSVFGFRFVGPTMLGTDAHLMYKWEFDSGPTGRTVLLLLSVIIVIGVARVCRALELASQSEPSLD
jgi:hypothetical protein